jgi:hypothetical protein
MTPEQKSQPRRGSHAASASDGVVVTYAKQVAPPSRLGTAIAEVVSAAHGLHGAGAPGRIDCYVNDDVVQCVLRDTVVEEQSHGAATPPSERQGPESELGGHSDLLAAIEELSGREVIASMTAEHVDPDVVSEVYILASPTTQVSSTLGQAQAGATTSDPLPMPVSQAERAAELAALEDVYRLTGVRLHRAQEDYARRYPGVAQRELVLASMVKRPDGGATGQRRVRR